MAQGKKIKAAYESIDREKQYPLGEAIALAVQSGAGRKFDESVDIALNLGIDAKQSDQTVRGAVSLPHGTGKAMRVAVFARDDKATAAKEAGADIVGAEDLAEEIQNGRLDFDRVIASPDMMGIVGRLGKVLGTKGLMPNPKLGTVTPDVAVAVKEAKAGQVQFRAEKAGVVHAGIGKASFKTEQLCENANALIDAVAKARPAGSKGVFIRKINVSTSMGPGVKVDPASATSGASAAAS